MITRAVTHIEITEANSGKLAVLDELASEYRQVCQSYVTVFCEAGEVDGFGEPFVPTRLSERWQRVAMMQAAGIAQAWLSNRARRYRDYEQKLYYYEQRRANDVKTAGKVLVWREPKLPILKQTCIQANVNVVALEVPNVDEMTPNRDKPKPTQQARRTREAQAKGITFDYWLRVATLDKRKPLYLPLRLTRYHREAIGPLHLNTSTTLNKRGQKWWLTVTVDDATTHQTPQEVVALDVGINNFITTSTGKHYGSFSRKIIRRHEREQIKRSRKAKLRASLEKKGVAQDKLPSVADARLGRHVRRLINEAVNQVYADHPHAELVIEDLDVAEMRFKSKRMNARLSASNLAHLPKQLRWAAAKRGLPLTLVHSAYSSQECSQCRFVSRQNRPNQQTFCCQCCGFSAHADFNAALNLLARADNAELNACRTPAQVKFLLDHRHHSRCSQGCRSLPSRLVGASHHESSPPSPSTGAGHHSSPTQRRGN